MNAILEPERLIPVRCKADVVVLGGGPSGIAAALAAARSGASTILVEKYGFLGGMGTAGLVSTFAYGYHDKSRFIIGGIFAEIRQKLFDRDGLIMNDRKGWEPFNPEIYKGLAFDLLEEAGVTVLCHTHLAGVVRVGSQLEAVIIESKAGREALVAHCFVDATGDGDVASQAGVPYEIGRPSDGATQPHTLMFMLGDVDIDKLEKYLVSKGKRGYWTDSKDRTYLNATGFEQEVMLARQSGHLNLIKRDHIATIYTVPWIRGVTGINLTRVQGKSALDPLELTQAEIEARKQMREGISFLRAYIPGFEKAEVVTTGPQIGIRETRRIMGDYVITAEDIVEQRQFDDVIAQSCYMIDIHSPDSDSTVVIKLPPGTHYDVPYRCLLPLGLDNLLLAGRCISATHEALGSFRVQAICMAIGEAAGTAAALAAVHGLSTRQVKVAELQQRLTAHGAILS